jgi:flagellar biosynthetic protein FliP
MQPRHVAGSAVPDNAVELHGGRHFARHYLEMLAAMVVGMLVLGAVTHSILALAGMELSTTRHPEPAALEMVFDMSVGMAVWMRHRGHGWASTLEMCGAMFAPLLVLFPLLRLDVIGQDSMITLEHLAMLPLMLVVMLRRRGEYGGRS